MLTGVDPLAIVQVSPYPWEDRHEVNTYVARLSEELTAGGHRVVVAAPSRDEEAVRVTRRAIRNGDVLGAPGEVRVLAVGEVLPIPTPNGSSAAAGRPRPARPLHRPPPPQELRLPSAFAICHVPQPFPPA